MSWRALVWLTQSGRLAAILLPRLVPGLLLVALLGLGLSARYDVPGVITRAGLVALVLLLALSAWPLGHTRSWDRLVVDRIHRRALLSGWQHACFACSLSVANPRAETAKKDKHGGYRLADVARLFPKVTRCKVRFGVAVMDLDLPAGLIVQDIERAAPRLASSLSVDRLVVVPRGPSGVRVTMTVRDLLAPVTEAVGPDPAAPVPACLPATFTLGRCEDGTPWTVPVGVSMLTAGATGAGKASILWSYLLELAPYVRAGLVRLYGVDLKGGMELKVGEGLFHRLATKPADAVDLLEEAAALMEARADRLAGFVRKHTPTVEEPMYVVVIDEWASLTAFADRAIRQRADVATGLLLSKGRAVSFPVLGFLQDPRKEVVTVRSLFPFVLGLRLAEESETGMVFGDGTMAALAPCHRISMGTPGVGYMVSTEIGLPVRFRAHYVADDTIRAVAAAFAPAQASNAAPDPTRDAVTVERVAS